MRCFADLIERPGDLPLLQLFIHHAPHRRQHIAVIQRYRAELVAAARAGGLDVPIRHKVGLWVLFVDPCSPDYDNLLMALYQALDGSTLAPPSLLADDKLIEVVERLSRFFPNGPTRADFQVRN